MHSIATPALWFVFAAIVCVALVVDFVVLRAHGPHKVSFREAAWWSLAWIALALAFNLGFWWWAVEQAGPVAGREAALEFLAGYLIEKALSVDNLFVFLLLFNAFAVPPPQRQKALMVGVLGAIVLRIAMILLGAALVARFEWILYLFGAFLIVTGVRMLLSHGQPPGDPSQSGLLRWMRGHLPISSRYHGNALSFREDGRRWLTPLFIVVVLIAGADVVFAVDSIPAIFAITRDPFVVMSSNVFAVLGLRALFFLLAGMADRFHLLGYGLSAVLLFIGAKMLIAAFWHVPVALALGVVALLIGGSIVASLVIPPRESPPTA